MPASSAGEAAPCASRGSGVGAARGLGVEPGLRGLGEEGRQPARRAPGRCRPAMVFWAAAEEVAARRARVVWCAVGPEERRKCDQWSSASNGKVTCASAATADDCIALALKGEADAMSLDGGLIYVAGKCGLLPVLAENQSK